MVEFVNPEAKTIDFFEKEVEELHACLPGIMVVLGNGAELRIEQTQPWFKDPNKVIDIPGVDTSFVIKRPGIEGLRAGDVWLSPLKFRGIDQTLIPAYDRGEVVACVRIVRASGSEVGTDSFTPFKNEGETAKFLIKNGGLKSNWVGRLRFLDVTDDRLSLRVLGPFEDVSARRLNFDEANRALGEFFTEV